MAIQFDDEGNVVLTEDEVSISCPIDPMDALQCDSCQ